MLGLVGGGAPARVSLTRPQPRPLPVDGAAAAEGAAGVCALASTSFVTGVIASTGRRHESVFTVHSGQRRNVFRLSGTSYPAGPWVSDATGTVAVLQDGRLHLFSDGSDRTLRSDVQAATAVGGSTLRLFLTDGRWVSRPY